MAHRALHQALGERMLTEKREGDALLRPAAQLREYLHQVLEGIWNMVQNRWKHKSDPSGSMKTSDVCFPVVGFASQYLFVLLRTRAARREEDVVCHLGHFVADDAEESCYGDQLLLLRCTAGSARAIGLCGEDLGSLVDVGHGLDTRESAFIGFWIKSDG